MIHLKMTVPVFKRNEFGNFDRKADIEMAGDFDNLSEGYSFLRLEIDEILKQSQAENTLLLNLHDLEREIANKQRTLQLINRDIEIAKKQSHRLQNFLEPLGIDPNSYSLLIGDGPIASAVAVEAEVDPIPFDSESHSSEF